MTLPLRGRILLTVTPLLLLLALLGVGAVLLLVQLGQQSGAILRENYESIHAMNRLRHAAREVERAGDPAARAIAWADLDAQVEVERGNLTILPREAELFRELEGAVAHFRQGGEREPLDALAVAIHDLNERQMQTASRQAQRTARFSLIGLLFGLAVAVAAVGLGLFGYQLTRPDRPDANDPLRNPMVVPLAQWALVLPVWLWLAVREAAEKRAAESSP